MSKSDPQPEDLEYQEDHVITSKEKALKEQEQQLSWNWKNKTWKERFAFLRSIKFWRVLLLGQLLSICITGTSVISTILGNDFDFNAPTMQTFLVYALLALVYNPYAIYKRGFRGWCNQFWERGVYYFFLGWVDMEGNYLVVKAYEYTSMLSAALLDSWSTPVCLILSFIFMRVRYRWVQYAGVFVALCGMGMLVGSDAMTGSTFMASDPVKGNLFCILGATFYGISNTSVEYLSRKHPIYEVNGMFTLFAAIINLVQMVILERNEFSAFVNNSYAIALVIVYTICMFILYSLAPVLFRWGSAVLYNLSLLTSDFYSLIFGLGLFGYSVTVMYPFAYVVIILGIGIYHIFPAPVPIIEKDDDPTKKRRKWMWFGFYFKTIPPRIPPEGSTERGRVADEDASVTKV
ncbi:hypothetical protein VTP01DRAFT_2682 [Rhizomucor pusillus]|uniref:uncharacterized protein n=1 Tax=Rhizomucor pusillus TaxID=4840 RepID=UPI003742F959